MRSSFKIKKDFTWLIKFWFLFLAYKLSFATGQLSHFDLGNRAYVMGDYQKALAEYEMALKDEVNSDFIDDALFLIGKCYLELKKTSEFQQIMEAIPQKYPQSDVADDALFLLGSFYLEKSQRQDNIKAMGYFQEILKCYPQGDKKIKALNAMGECHMALGNWEEAEKAFRQVFEFNPPPQIAINAHYNLGQIYKSPNNPNKNLQKAIGEYLKIMEKYADFADDPRYAFALASTYRERSEWDNAIKYYELVIQKYPDTFYAAVSQSVLGVCYEKKKEYDKSLEVLKNLLKNYAVQRQPMAQDVQKLIDQIKKKAEQKLTVSADSMDYNKETQTAVYNGNVKIVNNQTVILADRAEVNIEKKIVNSEGNIHLKNGEQFALSCGKLQYLVPQNLVVIEGNVLLQKEKEQVQEIKANKFILQLDSNNYQIE